MKIAQAIAVLARARAEGTTGDAATAAITHAAALAASHSAVVQIIAEGRATVRRFDDGSFLMIGSIALPMMGDLDPLKGEPTMVQAIECFEDAIADVLIAQSMATEKPAEERPMVPTGAVPRPQYSVPRHHYSYCRCGACMERKGAA